MVNIKQAIQKFIKERDWDKYHSPKNLVMALTGEVGELNEIFQWLDEKESYNLPKDVAQHTEEEIADIAIYLLTLCMKYDIDLEKAILSKIKKNEKKYPVDNLPTKFKKYTEQ